MKFQDIPETGIVTVGGKKGKWYDLYKFTEEQEKQWQDWALKELRKITDDAVEVMQELELIWGLVRIYKKKGELF